jgi:hypothetical protein
MALSQVEDGNCDEHHSSADGKVRERPDAERGLLVSGMVASYPYGRWKNFWEPPNPNGSRAVSTRASRDRAQ